MASPTASDVLADTLIEWGVDTIFGIPGDGINGIIEALRTRQDKLRFIQVRHEEAAAFNACAYAKWTGRLGVCLATSGPGGIHLLNGLYDAKLDGQPVLAITGLQFHDLLHTHTQQDVELDKLFVNRGGGTALAGQGCNVAVLIDFSKYLNCVLAIDADRQLAEVEPGCVLDTLRTAAETHRLTFGPDPATHDHNTLGGMLGNNSCGVHSVMAGRTSDNVDALEIVTYDGQWMRVAATSDDDLRAILAAGGRRAEIYGQLDEFRRRYGDLIRARYPKIPRRVSGYENLDELLPENGFNVARALVGTESTCVTILRARLNLMASPQHRVLAIIGFKDVFAAADAVPEILEFGPIGLEGIDQELIDLIQEKHYHPEEVKVLPKGGGWLIAEFGGDSADEAAALAQRLVDACNTHGHDGRIVRKPAQQAKIWDVREAALAVTAHKPDTWPGWEDSAVPRAALGTYLRELKALFGRYDYDASVYGHFGDGLIHCSINFNLNTEKGVSTWRRFLDDAAELVVKHGGSFSGEHGDGQARAALLKKCTERNSCKRFASSRRSGILGA